MSIFLIIQKRFLSSNGKVHKNQALFACAILIQPFAQNTKLCTIRQKMKELFWNIKSACRSKQIIMDLVTLCGIIHVYMHVLCLVAPSADQFFFLACLSHSKYGYLRISVNCTARQNTQREVQNKSLSQQSQICKILWQKPNLIYVNEYW